MSGTLYIVATPIGNLGDMTYRAVETLQAVDTIAAEDTRHTIKLLNHFDIHTPMMPYHTHNMREAGRKINNMLHKGKDIALVTDAGMPCVSDPGYELVHLAREEHHPVVVIPGASASVSALALSGFDSSRFVFEGFLPKETKDIRHRLDLLSREERVIILYESPHRIKKTLKMLGDVMGERMLCVANEITKLHEKVFIQSAADAAQLFDEKNPRGEYVIVIDAAQAAQDDWSALDISQHIQHYMDAGLSKMAAIKAVAKDRKVPKSEIYAHTIDPSSESS